MGEGTRASGESGRLGGRVAVLDDRDTEPTEIADEGTTIGRASEFDAGRRRFTVASVVGASVVAVPFLWILWGPWQAPDPIRKVGVDTNFYDLQARAMLHGHLWLANGAIGIEAFVHGGRQYTYFGLFPSLIRIPILLVTSSLDGKLTAPFILSAWLLTGLFTSLLLWRVRLLVRGQVVMGRGEAAASGLLVATVMGGTVWMLLASNPFVFNEDIAWSICLTVGSIFALLGLLERPSWSRAIASLLLVLAANLDRDTTGWATVVGAIMIAIWFGLGRAGRENRRWCIPTLGVGLVPLIIGCAVNYSKFGVLFGVSNYEQVWTHVNAWRRKFLAANHNAEEGIIFVPTNMLAYLKPDGLRLTSAFPFITLPSSPPPALGGVLFDRRYRTASITASTPLLVILSCWGMITAFRPRPVAEVAMTRFLLLASGSAGAALLLWGYIAPRYLGDFVPFLVLASAVGMADIWRRLEGRTRPWRVGALAVIGAVALFSIVANIGMAITPNEEWDTTQVLNYVQAQKAVSDVTGQSLSSAVVRGNTLPPWGPGDQIYVVGDCEGMYISNGEDYSTVPSQQYARMTWMAVERGHTYQHTFQVTFNTPPSGATRPVPLVSVGRSSVFVSERPTRNPNRLRAIVGVSEPGHPIQDASRLVGTDHSQQVTVVTDLADHLTEVLIDGEVKFSTTSVPGGRIVSDVSTSQGNATTSALYVVNDTASSSEPTLCQSLIH